MGAPLPQVGVRRARGQGPQGCGKSRSIDADLGTEIEAMRAGHPRMGAQMVVDALVAQGSMCAGEISVRTVQRWFSAHPPPGGEPEAKDRRAFEAAHANDMWQADRGVDRKAFERLAAAYLAETDYVDVAVRLDVVSLLVIGESRAMIRHCTNVAM